VFRLNPQNGRIVRLHGFGEGDADESFTNATLAPILASDGNLYGISAYRSIWDAEDAVATAYRISDPAGPVVNQTVPVQTSFLLERGCAYARLLGADNVPVAGAAFRFLRSGAHPGSALTVANGSGLASHCWVANTAGQDSVLASAASVSEIGFVNWSQRPVTLAVGGYIEALPAQQSITVRPRAQMSDTRNGAPIAGRLVRFLSDNMELCRAVTAADGSATCKTTVQQNAQTFLSHQYSAWFDGDSLYAAANHRGSLACVGGACTP
jgi:hypothetical protein